MEPFRLEKDRGKKNSRTNLECQNGVAMILTGKTEEGKELTCCKTFIASCGVIAPDVISSSSESVNAIPILGNGTLVSIQCRIVVAQVASIWKLNRVGINNRGGGWEKGWDV